MDYAAALIVYVASLLGVIVAISGMVAYKNDKSMVRFMSLCAFVFTLTTYLGGTMLNAIS